MTPDRFGQAGVEIASAGYGPTMQRGRSFVGCSGWMYRDWRGVVYPDDLPTRRWLGWYGDHLPTVEINSSFYRLPAATSDEGWAGSVPDDFVFAVKLGSFGTHRKKLRDAPTWLPNHFDRFAALGRRQGPVLVQLPPRWRRNAQRLDEFFEAAADIPAPHGTRWAVEIRDPSWLHDDVLCVLERHGAALCIHDLVDDHPRTMTTDWTYLRFHGPDALRHPYHGAYGTRRLRRHADWAAEVLDRGKDVYAYFNNDYEGHAFRDAARMRRLLASSPAA